MKLLRLRNGSFLFVVCCLLGCRDKQELGFLGNIEVGKYEITQFREYPNGSKDTLIWEAYGPYYQSAGKRYYFSIHDTLSYTVNWEIFEKGVLREFSFESNPYSVAYTYNNISIQSDFISLNYSYYQNNMTVGTDSTNGVINFKRMRL